MQQLLAFLNELDERKIYYRLNKVREDGIMVDIAVPGERWEVEFMGAGWPSGSIQIEKFVSAGQIFDCKDINQCKEIEQLFADFSD